MSVAWLLSKKRMGKDDPCLIVDPNQRRGKGGCLITNRRVGSGERVGGGGGRGLGRWLTDVNEVVRETERVIHNICAAPFLAAVARDQLINNS
jgi:hypothetical protein